MSEHRSLIACGTRGAGGTVILVSVGDLERSVGEDRNGDIQAPPLPGRDHQPLRWLNFRFSLSFREVEELMLARGRGQL